MHIHQLTYGMMLGDAITNHVLEIDARLRAWGYATTIYAQHVAPEMVDRVRPDNALVPHLANTNDVLIYHYSIYSPNTRLFRAARSRKILIYHNITPPEFFASWDAEQAALCELGRNTLHALTGCDLALGDSEFNRQELLIAGFPADKTGVLPIFLAPQRFETMVPVPTDMRLRSPDVVNWLTVGRIVPNKCLEDVIRVFYLYARYINPAARLNIVGSRYIHAYNAALEELLDELDLFDRVSLVNRVTDAALGAYYRTADLYLCASQHEGFCVPLIESMYFGVPIVARATTAVSETLGTSGILFTRLGYEAVAEMAHLLVTDDTLRSRVIDGQRARLTDFSPERAEAALRSALQRIGLSGN